MIVIGLLLLAALIATAAGLAAEDRPHMKTIDVSPARQDRGEWIELAATDVLPAVEAIPGGL